MEQEHKRRVRYSGTHPRNYREKYKELNPERYQADVKKILESGKTPAGMHIPILVDEILEFLQIQPGQIGYDATLGYGGHTRRRLEQLQDTAATPAGCWSSSRGRAISTPPTWTAWSRKRPGPVWRRWAMARRS